MTILVKPTFYWKLMNWWLHFSGKASVQTGSIFYGGQILIAMWFDTPGQRSVIAQTSMTLEQAKHFHAELTRQLERFEVFGS